MSDSIHLAKSIYDLNGFRSIAVPSENSNSKKAKTCHDRRLTMSNRINNGLPGSKRFKCLNNMQISASNVSIISDSKRIVSLKCACDPNYIIVCCNVENPTHAIMMFNLDHGVFRNANGNADSDSDSDDDSDDDSDYIPNEEEDDSDSDSDDDSDDDSDSDYIPNEDEDEDDDSESDSGSDSESDANSDTESDYNEGYTVYYPSDSEEE